MGAAIWWGDWLEEGSGVGRWKAPVSGTASNEAWKQQLSPPSLLSLILIDGRSLSVQTWEKKAGKIVGMGAFLQWAMHVNRGWGSLSLFHFPSLDWFCVPVLEPWLAFHFNVTFCGETVIGFFLFSLRLKCLRT